LRFPGLCLLCYNSSILKVEEKSSFKGVPDMQCAKNNERHLQSSEAFSLVELIVVIGIIAVIAGLVVPTLEVLREKGKETACANNMRQWGTAMGMYLDENRSVFPKDGTEGDEAPIWYNVLPPYIGVEPFYALKAKGKAPCPGMGKSIYICPCVPTDSAMLAKYTGGSQMTYALSYAMNYWINAPKENASLSTRMRLSQVKHSEQFVVFSEPADTSLKSVDSEPTNASLTSAPDFRHRGRVNVVFADGHVAPVRKMDIFTQVQWNPHFEPGQAPVPGASE
jgi:prepilin-type processing-associated H-X9-DG protein